MFSLRRSMAPFAMAIMLLSSVFSVSIVAADMSGYAGFKIENARSNGEIDTFTSLLYRLMIHSGKTVMLPEKYAGEIIPEECGTPFLIELSNNWSSFTEEQKNQMISVSKYCKVFEAQNEDQLREITRALHPTLTEELESKKKHFLVHYTTTADAESNEITDLKLPKTVADAMEVAYKWINDKYGKTAKNTSAIDVYLINSSLMGGSWGECWKVDVSGQTCKAYIHVKSTISSDTNANYPKFGPKKAKSTPAHEYFHAVQFNIDCTESSFMMESSAAWSEGAIFSDNKTYVVIGNRLPLFNEHPNWPVWYEDGGYCYASMMFQRYLNESLRDVYVNADMWTECGKVAGNNSVSAIGTVLTARGLDWDGVMKDFGKYNYFKSYKDYSKYKKIWTAITPSGEHNTYGVDETSPTTQLFELGTDYVSFKKPAGLGKKNGGELLIKFKPVTGDPVKAALLLAKGKKVQIVDFPEDSQDDNGYYEYMSEGFLKLDEVVLMTQVRTTTGTDNTVRHYTYAAACPMVELNTFDPDPASMGSNSWSTLTLNFDVTGCWDTMDYPLKFKLHQKGPAKVNDGVTDVVLDVRNGEAQTTLLYFYDGAGEYYVPGTYKFGIQFIFGTTKKPIAKTNILWLSVVCEPEPESATGSSTAVKGAGKAPSISFKPLK